MNGMISIIVPVYNRQDVIEECIRSVTAQSYQNFEILLIDDGSLDKTLEICLKLAESEPRIKVLQGEHTGVSGARNKGIDASCGEYIFFMDSDDVIHPLLLETLVDGMKNSDATIAGTADVEVHQRNWHKVKRIIENDIGPGKTTHLSNSDTLKEFFSSISPLNIIGGVMMRRDLIGETRFRTDLFIGEDLYFSYENLIKGANTVFLNQRWYFLRLHKNNSSRNFSFSAFWSRFYRRELVWKSEEKFGRTEYVNCQKRDAFYGVYLPCIVKNKVSGPEAKKMCKVMRDYKKILLPAMPLRGKLHYYLFVYIPYSYQLSVKINSKLRRLKARFKR